MKEIVTDVEFLHQKSTDAEVENGKATQETLDIIQELVESIPGPNKALGLSAPQIGILKRVFIARVQGGFYAFINPEYNASLEGFPSTEGCLSLPGIQRTINRQRELYFEPSALIYKINDDNSLEAYEREVNWEFKNLDASVIQHEDDHLEGVIITDLEELEPPPAPEPELAVVSEKVLEKLKQRRARIQKKRDAKKYKNQVKKVQKINPKKKAKAEKKLKAARKRLKKRVELQAEIAAMKKDAEEE